MCAATRLGAQSALTQVTKMIREIRKSSLSKKALQEACKKTQIKFRLPPTPVKTRWNSLHLMIEAVLPMKTAVVLLGATASSEDLKKWGDIFPENKDWALLEAFEAVLEAKVTKVWQSDSQSITSGYSQDF